MRNTIDPITNTSERNYHLEDRGGNLLFLQELLSLKDFGSDNKVLEIGCGTGLLASYFKSIKNIEIFGTEVSKSAYEVAKNRIECFYVKDGRIPVNLSGFDLIYCKDVLPMISDKFCFYKNIFESLSNDGIFCTYLPSSSDIKNKPILKFIPNSIKKSLESYLSIEENYNFLKKAGFSSIDLKKIDLGSVSMDSKYCKKHEDGFFSNTDREKNSKKRITNLQDLKHSINKLNSMGFYFSYNWIRTMVTAKK